MNWTTTVSMPQKSPEHKDVLKLTDKSRINIEYDIYPMTWLIIDPGYEFRSHIDPADREGTRRMVLRELLPLAEEALAALRKAVAELEPPKPSICGRCGAEYAKGIASEDDGACEDCLALYAELKAEMGPEPF